jgi:hypothetical protein
METIYDVLRSLVHSGIGAFRDATIAEQAIAAISKHEAADPNVPAPAPAPLNADEEALLAELQARQVAARPGGPAPAADPEPAPAEAEPAEVPSAD